MSAQAEGSIRVTYGFTIQWTVLGSGVKAITADGHSTPEAAEASAWQFARVAGWKPRRWWQLWRIGDTPNPKPPSSSASDGGSSS